MSEAPEDGGAPGRARAVYRRLRSAAGVSDLPALELRVAELETEVGESSDLEVPLRAAVDRVERALVPLLEARVQRREQRLEQRLTPRAPGGPGVVG